jgi:hypothetical protein
LDFFPGFSAFFASETELSRQKATTKPTSFTLRTPLLVESTIGFTDICSLRDDPEYSSGQGTSPQAVYQAQIPNDNTVQPSSLLQTRTSARDNTDPAK